MKIATVPRITTADRLAALEARADTHDQLFEPMAKRVQEIHELLLGAKAIIWFVGKVSAWVGGPGALAGAGWAVWRALH
ncbi:hypothetical protein JJC00_18860 [Bradyrhizobium diazoefficiens]|uniref:hypothetical protein n=1 Tax=Bradyrhizobium diazoefficiens TaxID=1355477 RepID=UPI00190A66A4|nr:hypothetical protein [Bradyrhizobium diazoefficiens]QQO30746.1 hypothetical protein JJC00_18860 [Bradyrhizobium diazoefficiens]